MKNFKGKKLLAVLLATMMVLVLITPAAMASQLDVAFLDVELPVNNITMEPGESKSITIKLTVTGPQGGPATFKINRNWSLENGSFTSSNPQTITVGERTNQDEADIFVVTANFTVDSSQGDGSYAASINAYDVVTDGTPRLQNNRPGNLTVNVVTPPSSDTTPPVITIISPSDGAVYQLNQVVLANWTVTDDSSIVEETGNVNKGQPIDTSSEGLKTFSVYAEDEYGNNDTQTVTYEVRDTEAPTITWDSNNPTPNSYGWFNGPVSLGFKLSDPSGVDYERSTLSPLVFDSEGAGQTQDVEAWDSATTPNHATYTSPEVSIDWTAPSITGNTDRAANSAGWYNDNVTVSFTANDALSGIASVTPDTVLYEGENQSVTGTAMDKAGNSATTTVSGINIDKTKPTITIGGNSYSQDSNVDLGDVVIGSTIGWTAFDGLSGLATSASESIAANTPNSQTATITATDNAGNTTTLTVIYRVVFEFNGFFKPIKMDGPNNVKAGSAVPIKFSLNGNQGLNIFFTGYPKSQPTVVEEQNDVTILETVNAGQSSLSYDATADQYTYVWKTDKAWAGKARQLMVKFADGNEYTVDFSFK